MGRASNGLVNQLQADAPPTIHITLPRMIRFLIATAYPLLSKFISFVLAGFKDLHCIQVWIPTYPIQMNASYIS